MNNIQKLELDILKDFKKLCEKEKLHYYAIGGTCIGAIRHNGFIPWDDDIDVAMPINDYLRLKECAKKGLRKKHKLIDCEKINGNTKVFIKITNIETTYIEEGDIGNESNYQGVYIDIMPISGCPKDSKKQKKYYRRLKKYKRLHFYRNSKYKNLATKKQRIVWFFLHPLSLIHGHGYYLDKWHKKLMKYDINKNNGVIFPWRKTDRAFFDYDSFSKSIKRPFEDTSISVPIGYDKYLRKDFGNYMSLPPEEERKSVHQVAIIDLKKSFMEYTSKKGVL